MPINIQKRLRQAGTIRIGAKVATKNGGSRPTKLDAFRVTSPDRAVIESVAEVFGGEVQSWEGAPSGTTQWEVYTKATEMEVVLPPTDIAFSQWFELWSGSGCQRRCTGEFMVVKEGKSCDEEPCICDPDNQLCRPTTRLNVLLAAIDGIGVFRTESHGYSSAAELGGSIEILKQLQARGTMVPGRLLLEPRQSTRLNPTSGKPEVFHYAVIVLDFKFNVASLQSGEQRTAIGVTPIHAELPAATSVADQIASASTPQERPRRSNAAAPLPSTGLKPKGLSTKPDIPTETQDVGKTEQTDRTEGGASQRSFKRLMAILNGKKLDDAARHAWARGVLGYDKDAEISFKQLDQAAISKLNDAASDIGSPVETLANAIDEDTERPF